MLEKIEVVRMSKREDYINWGECFMGMALMAALRSKDPNTQVGACIVNNKNRLIGAGYNGFPNGCSDDELPWGRNGDYLDTKYPYVCHAEKNAIHNTSNKDDLDGATLYTTLFPCNDCAKDIIQSGIKKVIYLSDKYHDKDFTIAAKTMFEMAGVKCEKFTSRFEHLIIDFREK
jgi:dCMP deaminase